MIKFPKIQSTVFSMSLASAWYALVNLVRRFTEHFPFTNTDTALVDGEVLYISGNRSCARATANGTQAQARFAAVCCEPTAQNDQGVMRTQGIAWVLFEPGIDPAPAPNDVAYVADTPGRANVAEGTTYSSPFGTIEDASTYATDGGCYVNLGRCCQPVLPPEL